MSFLKAYTKIKIKTLSNKYNNQHDKMTDYLIFFLFKSQCVDIIFNIYLFPQAYQWHTRASWGKPPLLFLGTFRSVLTKT